MNQAIKMPCRVFDVVSSIIVAFQVEYICDQVEGILVVLDLCIEAGEIETVGEVFFIYFAEVFVAA